MRGVLMSGLLLRRIRMFEVLFYMLCPVVLFLVYGFLLERFW
jgi:hypothetical protein